MHLVQRLLSLRENKGFGSGEVPRRGSPTSDSGGAELRRFGRGASLPTNPCSFVQKHHVSRAQSAGGVPDVVPHSPQTLIPSSGSTTSLGSKAPAAYRTWCLTPHKPLFLRPEAPRLSCPMGLRRHGRGASPPASPYSFVRKHHVPRSGWADALTDVVLHSPQNLISPFPLHQVFVPFQSTNPSDLVQRLPQNLIPPFPLHQVFVPFWSSNPSDLVQRLPQNLVLSFLLHQVRSPNGPYPDEIGKKSSFLTAFVLI